MLGVQRLFFGSLRPSEIEQLYEKSWYAITETCLAMTIFRDEVGGWFLVMFVSLLIGKVWGWIGEGRVEILEQQPPTDPRFFHVRLSISLMSSSLFEMLMFRYSVQTVLLQARPNMMVMFAFEFAVLTVTSLSTAARYLISLHESSLIRNRIARRRAQLSQELQGTQESTHAPGLSDGLLGVDNPQEARDGTNNDVDTDVPGWEDKGRWVFYLDLITGKSSPREIVRARSHTIPDFCKLILYLTFFSVLCMFYGMPIHIIRDVAITVRSFYKRMSDFIRYRQATKDMNTRYPDATSDEIQKEDVCIICREVMYALPRPYGAPGSQSSQRGLETNNHGRVRQINDNGATVAGDERYRPKKLPCGHILHYTCLRSWLERQQNCPICRAPVIVSNPVVPRSRSDNTIRNIRAQENQPPNNDQVRGEAPQLDVGRNTFNVGPLRLSFGVRQGFVGEINNANTADQRSSARVGIESEQRPSSPGILRQGSSVHGQVSATLASSNIQSQLLLLEQQLLREIRSLGAHATQLFLVRALEAELLRLRIEISQEDLTSIEHVNLSPPFAMDSTQESQLLMSSQFFASHSEQQNVRASHQDLPGRLVIPHDWNIVSLRRIKIDRETTDTISSIPIFNSVASGNSTTNRSTEPTFRPSMVKSQAIKQPISSSGTGTNIEWSLSGLSTSHSFSEVSNVCSKKTDADTHVIKLWNEFDS